MGLITLGSVTLEGFEVPSCVKFGGKQRVIVHKLIGGGRVIDSMGRDDSALQWNGVLSGVGAADRARALDVMRATGALQSLTWDAFCYAVVISDLRLSFLNPWWIPYEITCTVQQDLAYSPMLYSRAASTAVVNDLAEVSQLLGVSDTLSIQSVSSLISSGPEGQRSAVMLIAQLQQTMSQEIAIAESGLASSDVGSLVSSTGSIAQICCAQGYLARSIANITDVSF